jgi:hypothetical protein
MMDKHIELLPFVLDQDLALNTKEGIAYQKDMSFEFEYGEKYFETYVGYKDTPMEIRLNKCRNDLVSRHYGNGYMVDIGIGSGAFIRSRPMTHGKDVNRVAIEWLCKEHKHCIGLNNYPALSFWDVLEHVKQPQEYLDLVRNGAYIFVSIPIFEDLKKIRESKHYRPNEHLYYFTEKGFINWLSWYGFKLLEVNQEETLAGREGITSFAFKRIRYGNGNL